MAQCLYVLYTVKFSRHSSPVLPVSSTKESHTRLERYDEGE